MARVKKYRLSTWYWGNYWTKEQAEKNGFDVKDMKVYVEKKHGWKNSEEYKRGIKEPLNITKD